MGAEPFWMLWTSYTRADADALTIVSKYSTIVSLYCDPHTMPDKALGAHYFARTGYPIAAVRVRIDGTRRISHPHDLTEREHDHDFRELVIVLRGKARRMLEEGIKSSAEIGYAVGYNDQSYFIRHFHRRTGMTPGKYARGRLRQAVQV